MRKLLILPMLTEYGPGEVAIDRDTAAEMIPVLQAFVEEEDSRPRVIDLVLCERCEIYVVFAGHECMGVQ